MGEALLEEIQFLITKEAVRIAPGLSADTGPLRLA